MSEWIKNETGSCPVSPWQMVFIRHRGKEYLFPRFAGMYSKFWGDEDGVKDWWVDTISEYKIPEQQPMTQCVEHVAKSLDDLGIHNITPRQIETIIMDAGCFIRDNMSEAMVKEAEKEYHSPGDGFRSAMCEALTEISTAIDMPDHLTSDEKFSAWKSQQEYDAAST